MRSWSATATPLPSLPALHDRARDAWEALLAIGEGRRRRMGPEQPATHTRACEAISAELDPETGAGEMLLADLWAGIQGSWKPESTCRPASETINMTRTNPAILPALIAMEGRPWSEWLRNRPLSPRGLASLAQGFRRSLRAQFASQRVQADGKGLQARVAFEPVWKRYGIPSPEDSLGSPSVTASQPRAEARVSGRLHFRHKRSTGCDGWESMPRAASR